MSVGKLLLTNESWLPRLHRAVRPALDASDNTPRCLQGLAASGVASSGLREDCLTVAVGLEEADEGRQDVDVILKYIVS